MSDPGSTERAQSWLVALAHEHRVSPTQRRVIQHMLASLPGVAFASTIEVAEAAGVSQPTVTRLASALGYAGYPEFRNAMREIVLSPDAVAEGATGWIPPSSALGSEQQNLAELERMIDSADVIVGFKTYPHAGRHPTARHHRPAGVRGAR